LAQICGDWLSIARRQTGGIAVLCRGCTKRRYTLLAERLAQEIGD